MKIINGRTPLHLIPNSKQKDTGVELWKRIPGNENYEASNLGRIKRVDGVVLSPVKAGAGYRKVKIHKQQPYVHTLIALAWIGNIPDGWQVNHLNLDKTDNRVSNLEICTPSENMRHAYHPEWYLAQTRLNIFQ